MSLNNGEFGDDVILGFVLTLVSSFDILAVDQYPAHGRGSFTAADAVISSCASWTLASPKSWERDVPCRPRVV